MTTTQTAPGVRIVPRDAVPLAAPAAVGGALILAIGNALTAGVLAGSQPTTSADYLAVLGQNQTLVLLGSGLFLVALLLIVPGVWAVAHRLRERAPVLASVGGWLMATGYVCAMVLVIEDQAALAVIGSGGDPATYLDAMDNHTTIVALVINVLFGVGGLIGPVLLGIAMLRQRDTCPTWAGVVLLASAPVRIAGLALGIFFLPAVASLMLAVAFGVVLLNPRRAKAGTDVD